MSKVRSIGLWSKWVGVDPSPSHLLGSGFTEEERNGIAVYIETTPEMMGYTYSEQETCHLPGEHQGFDPIIRCDGEWLYPQSFAYYVRKGVRVPAEFVARVQARDYKPPTDRVDFQIAKTDEGSYWIRWSLTHSSPTPTYFLFIARLLVFFPIRLALLPFRRFLSIRGRPAR